MLHNPLIRVTFCTLKKNRLGVTCCFSMPERRQVRSPKAPSHKLKNFVGSLTFYCISKSDGKIAQNDSLVQTNLSCTHTKFTRKKKSISGVSAESFDLHNWLFLNIFSQRIRIHQRFLFSISTIHSFFFCTTSRNSRFPSLKHEN